jgi:Arc/MetJ-type ribon-helix-helix transcriptional regulator
MPDTEKVTINVSAVDLGKIDLLVQEGLYSNRTDFIRTSIRNLIDKHSLEIQQTVTRYSYVIGVLVYNHKDFEEYKKKGQKLKIDVIGFFHITDDVSPELAKEVIDHIRVRGIFQANDALKTALADLIK